MTNITNLGKPFAKMLAKERFSRERLLSVWLCAVAMLLTAVVLGVCRYYGLMVLSLFLFGCFAAILIVSVIRNRMQWSMPITERFDFSEERVLIVAKDRKSGADLQSRTIPYNMITGVFPDRQVIVLQINRQFLVLDKNGFEGSDPEHFCRFLKEHISPDAWKYPSRARIRSCISGVGMLLASAAILAGTILFFSGRTSKRFATLPDGISVDITEVLEAAGQAIGMGELKDPQKQVLQLDNRVYLVFSEWDTPFQDEIGYLPIIVYWNGGSWDSTVFGHNAVDLTGFCPAANHDIAATFAQECGDYIIINIGSDCYRYFDCIYSVPSDSLGTKVFHLSSQSLGAKDPSPAIWMYLANQDGVPTCAGVTVSEQISSDILVIYQMPDTYTVHFGDTTLSAESIRSLLLNPYQGDDPLYIRRTSENQSSAH